MSPEVTATSWLVQSLQRGDLMATSFEECLEGRFYYIISDGSGLSGVDTTSLSGIASPEIMSYVKRLISGNDSPINRNISSLLMSVDRNMGSMLIHNHNYMPFDDKLNFYKKWLYKYSFDYDNYNKDDYSIYSYGDENDFISALIKRGLEYSVRVVFKKSIRAIYEIPIEYLPELMLLDQRQLTGMDQQALLALRDKQMGYVIESADLGERRPRTQNDTVTLNKEILTRRLLRLRTNLRLSGIQPSQQQMLKWARLMHSGIA